MFERFTHRAIKVIMLAQEEARRTNLESVGVAQILLGLIGEGTGIAAKALKSEKLVLRLLGQSSAADDFSKRVETTISEGVSFSWSPPPHVPGETVAAWAWSSAYLQSSSIDLPMTGAALHAIELAEYESKRVGQSILSCEFILLGLMEADEGLAFRVMTDFEITADKLKTEVLRGVEITTRCRAVSFSLEAKSLVLAAYAQSARRGEKEVGTLHLLLAIEADRNLRAHRILFGLTPQYPIHKLGEAIETLMKSDLKEE